MADMFRGTVGKLFHKSPFGQLVEHAKKSVECVSELRGVLEHYINEKYEDAEKLVENVSRLEHEADEIKFEIRENLPNQLFMPVARGDLLDMLSEQDHVADFAQDVAVLIGMKRTPIPDEIKDDFIRHVNLCIECAEALEKAVEEVSSILESSFARRDIKELKEHLRVLNEKEHQADIVERALTKKLFALENKVSPISIVHLLKVIDRMDQIANSAENTGGRLRMMMAN